MANSFQGLTSGLGMLKTFYQGPLIESINNDCPVYCAAEKIKNQYSGNKVARPIRVRRNQGIGATSDGGNLPSIGRQTVVQAEIQAKYNYLRFGITGPMLAASKSDAGSFVRAASYELKSGYMDLKNDINRQLSWDGVGDLAAVNTASVASQSLTIKGRESTEPALKFIDVGQVLDIYDSTGVTLKASGVTVSSISSGDADDATATILLDTPVTTAANDILVRNGSVNQEISGLLYALDGATSTIYNVDRSLYLSYQGNVISNSSGALTLDVMQQAFNEGLRRGNVGSYSACFTDFATLRYYQKLLTPDKRYVNSMQGDGSFGAKGKFYLEFNGIPVVADKDCPTRIFFLPAEVLKLYVLQEMAFADESGGMNGMIAQVDTDSYEVRIRHFVNLFNEQPAACSVVTSYISP